MGRIRRFGMDPERVRPYAGIRPVAIASDSKRSKAARARVQVVQGHAVLPAAGRGHSLWGTRAADAVRREIREEIGGEIEGVRHLGTLENIFERDGSAGPLDRVCLRGGVHGAVVVSHENGSLELRVTASGLRPSGSISALRLG